MQCHAMLPCHTDLPIHPPNLTRAALGWMMAMLGVFWHGGSGTGWTDTLH
jgi:hypothetical protein